MVTHIENTKNDAELYVQYSLAKVVPAVIYFREILNYPNCM